MTIVFVLLFFSLLFYGIYRIMTTYFACFVFFPPKYIMSSGSHFPYSYWINSIQCNTLNAINPIKHETVPDLMTITHVLCNPISTHINKFDERHCFFLAPRLLCINCINWHTADIKYHVLLTAMSIVKTPQQTVPFWWPK